LVLDRRLDGHVVDLVQVLCADAPLVVVGLEPLQPLRDRVRADHRGRQQQRLQGVGSGPVTPGPGGGLGSCHRGQSLTSAVSVFTLAPGSGANWTLKPRRLPVRASSGPLTQLTTEPSYLPGP